MIATNFASVENEPKSLTFYTSDIVILGLFIVIYVAIMAHYLINAHDNFYTFHNLAEFENWYWQFLNGRPFTTSMPKPSPHLYVGQLVILPFYALWTSTKTLLIARSFWIAFGAVPIYLLARSVSFSRVSSLLASIVFFLNPIIIQTSLNQHFSAEPFAIPVFLTALYAIFGKRPILFFFRLFSPV